MLTIRVNGEPQAVAAATVAGLLDEQGMLGRRGVAVAVNGEVVPASGWHARELAPGDEVEIVKPVGGG
jgi:sulfur carrier protein